MTSDATGPSAPGTTTPNQVLAALRTQRGWGRTRLARELDDFCARQGWPRPGRENLQKQIYRLERGQVHVPDEFYTRLFCSFFEKSAHELFGITEDAPTGPGAARWNVRSHKFIPSHIGPEHAQRLLNIPGFSPLQDDWLPGSTTPVDREDGDCHLAVWPFGVAMFHLVEDLEFGSIAELAVWRIQSYETDTAWAQQRLRALTGSDQVEPPYVLSAYWVQEAPCSGPELQTALRLMCIPRSLLDRDADDATSPLAHAQLVERSLLRDGFDHPEMVDFGMQGIAHGLASWSGVVYHPTAPTRCTPEDELVACELAAQAVWAYCHFIRTEIEQGRDPVVPPQYGWRFLRGIQSRLTTARPRETEQHRAMREAIVSTSGLAEHLPLAVETLKEAEGANR